jgi:hypothetical protein
MNGKELLFLNDPRLAKTSEIFGNPKELNNFPLKWLRSES